MKKLLFLSFLIALVACGEKENKDGINSKILNVSIGDTGGEVKAKLDEQGVKWEENDWGVFKSISVSGGSFIGKNFFQEVDYTLAGQNVMTMSLGNTYTSENYAREAFERYREELMSKYGKYKTDKTNEVTLEYLEFYDGKTELSLMLYHTEANVFEDECWNVSLMYGSINSFGTDKDGGL